jgi:endoglycosylceramidase
MSCFPVQYLKQLGIVTILDFHQDAYSRWMNGGCGDGFPEWATPAALIQLNPLNRVPNFPGKCHFPQDTSQGLDPWSNAAFVAFYANWNGVRDSFLNAWDKLAGIHCPPPLNP